MTEAFENACYLAQNGFPVFPSSRIFGPGTEDIATCDLAMLERMHAIDPQAVWLVKCGVGGGGLALACLDSPRVRDYDILVNDYGPLQQTLTVSRDSGGPVRWYSIPRNADIKLGARMRGTQAHFRKSAIIPGSVLATNRETYRVLGGGPFDIGKFAPLPELWMQVAPKNTLGVTENLVLRPEFEPRRSDW